MRPRLLLSRWLWSVELPTQSHHMRANVVSWLPCQGNSGLLRAQTSKEPSWAVRRAAAACGRSWSAAYARMALRTSTGSLRRGLLEGLMASMHVGPLDSWTPGLLGSRSRPTKGNLLSQNPTQCEKFALVRPCVASAGSLGSFLRQAMALKLSAHLAKGLRWSGRP